MKDRRREAKRYQKRNPMSQRDAGDFLLQMCSLFDENDIQYWLVFGTALGVYRDGQFISHDIDIDLGFLRKDEHKVEKLKKELQTRHEKNIITFTLNNISMDCYFFEDKGHQFTCYKYYIEKDQMDFLMIYFLGRLFRIVNNPEEYFNRLYGSLWQTPQIGVHAKC